MKVKFSPEFYKIYKKKIDVRTANRFNDQLSIFRTNPLALELHNHKLIDKWEGFISIDITNDYRAIYQEISEGVETVAYFITLGTHKELYRQISERQNQQSKDKGKKKLSLKHKV